MISTKFLKKITFFFLVLTFLPIFCAVYAQGKSTISCGIDSAIALGHLLGKEKVTIDQLQAQYPNPTVSLLDVKHMGQRVGFEATGIKASFQELLDDDTPCIIGLKGPDHFIVLLDGQEDDVRIMDGPGSIPQVVPRRAIEARFTGYALVPIVKADAIAPRLQMPLFDRDAVFNGIGQKVEYHFPLQNIGNAPLSVQITSTSCGCTAAVFQSKDSKNLILAPKGQSEIIVLYQVQSQVPVQQMATIKTNDPHHPVIYLSIRGQLPPQLTLSPPALYVDQDLGEEPGKIFRVIGPKNTQIEKMWSDVPYLQLQQETEEVNGERVQWPVSVSGFSNAPTGPINGKINIRLTNGQEVFLQVRGIISGQLPGVTQAALLPRAEDDPQTPIGSPLPILKIGEASPDFRVVDATGNLWSLSALKGQKNVLLTFFPKCFTGGCATQLSSLRDRQTDFDAAQTQILAVSIDPAEGEKGQIAFAKQWGFNFPLIPDVKRQIGKQFGAIQNDDERAARLTFLIDKKGIVRFIDTNVSVQTHGADMLAKIHELGLDAEK